MGINQILDKKCEYNETMHQLLIDFKKANDSLRREVLYNILSAVSPLKTSKDNKNVSK
jgi:hypothetical protein